jgi:tryptophan synthase alpha chain
MHYLQRVRGLSGSTPVLAGFGIRSATQVAALAPHCDGVVVGSALVRTLLDGGDPAATLRGLRPVRSAA